MSDLDRDAMRSLLCTAVRNGMWAAVSADGDLTSEEQMLIVVCEADHIMDEVWPDEVSGFVGEGEESVLPVDEERWKGWTRDPAGRVCRVDEDDIIQRYAASIHDADDNIGSRIEEVGA